MTRAKLEQDVSVDDMRLDTDGIFEEPVLYGLAGWERSFVMSWKMTSVNQVSVVGESCLRAAVLNNRRPDQQ